MQTSLLDDDDTPDPAALAAAAARRATPGRLDELRGRVFEPVAPGGAAQAGFGLRSGPAALSTPAATNPLAPHWRDFFTSLGGTGWSDLRGRHQRIQRRVREDGATYNVYAERGDATRPWPLELLPFIVEADDWAVIESGVRQRARLLQAALADIYGKRHLLREGLLPASLVYAHPQYLREMNGVAPRGGIHLHLLAFDLVRNPGGGWSLLAQRVQAPSGMGYLLENRLIVGPQFSDEFAALRVQRLASSFQSLLEGLMRLSPAGARSRMVLLTPGPHNETYFEQVFLARYLGLTLVEGGDLTVRGTRLYLKTLHGLERVHVVLRRVDDEWLDPLELRPDSALGVPGLLQALRSGDVVVANLPGAGFLESPGLSAFWPGVAERLLGEDLALPSPTTWWCGEEAVWRAQRDRLADFVVAPTFPGSGFAPVVAADLDPEQRLALRDRITADPAAFTLQVPVQPSETPVWNDDRLEPRPAVLRVFTMSDGAMGWRVLPGALARVASRREGQRDPLLSMQHGSTSADTWVMTDGEVDRSSLLPKPLSAADMADWHRTVTSRSAESLFWLGRYTERAENSTRLARLALEALPAASPVMQRVIGSLVLAQGMVGADVPMPHQSHRVFERALIHSLGAAASLTSVGYNLRALGDCAQALRERLSPEHWKLIHEVDDHFEQHLADVLGRDQATPSPSDVLGVLARTTTHLAAITGAQTDRMTRDDGWRLLSVGRQLERLDSLSSWLANGFEHHLADSDEGFALLLGLFDSLITYRAQFQGRREVMALLHLLVFDTDNPRSLAWVARTLRDRLRKLARHDPVWVTEVTATFPVPESWSLEALSEADGNGHHTALIQALRLCASAARGLSEQISHRLFVHVGAPSRTVWQ